MSRLAPSTEKGFGTRSFRKGEIARGRSVCAGDALDRWCLARIAIRFRALKNTSVTEGSFRKAGWAQMVGQECRI